jgi:hypothetical protein
MEQDSVIKEIRAVRETLAERFNYDLEALHCFIKEQERKSGRQLVTFPPKRIKPDKEVHKEA